MATAVVTGTTSDPNAMLMLKILALWLPAAGCRGLLAKSRSKIAAAQVAGVGRGSNAKPEHLYGNLSLACPP